MNNRQGFRRDVRVLAEHIAFSDDLPSQDECARLIRELATDYRMDVATVETVLQRAIDYLI